MPNDLLVRAGSEMATNMRKYDRDVAHPLRIIEQLHYHCSHNPKYIDDLKRALRETGMLDDNVRTVRLKLKKGFKQTSLYEREFVWINDRIRNKREDVTGLDAYKIESYFTYPRLMTGYVTEVSAFDRRSSTLGSSREEPISRDFKLTGFDKAILRFAMDANDFFHFENLRIYFPHLAGTSQFITSETYLGGVTVSARGLRKDLDTLTARQKLDITKYVLNQIGSGVKHESIDYIGTRRFKPYPIKDRFTDRILKLRVEGETGRSWTKSALHGLDQIDLSNKEWHAYDDSYGTDQEKHFIQYLNDQADRLQTLYDDFYLLRNEKAVKLFAFENGQAFEPDFVLFLRKKNATASTILQLFIEPKGSHLIQFDNWKERFLKDIKDHARIETIFQSRNYTVYGLPFFNETGSTNADFKDAFEEALDHA